MQKEIILADNQDITFAGLTHVCREISQLPQRRVEDKAALIERLKQEPEALVIIDYTLFDINDADELLILNLRYPKVQWLLFSEDLSRDFARQLIIMAQNISILLKESPLGEIKTAIQNSLNGSRYVCQRMTELLLMPTESTEERVRLTKTETEILKDIAAGMTTKEIAESRFSSFHTVNTHRKNIFRKLGVNNVHEATKYALRAGLVDSAEYYI